MALIRTTTYCDVCESCFGSCPCCTRWENVMDHEGDFDTFLEEITAYIHEQWKEKQGRELTVVEMQHLQSKLDDFFCNKRDI